MTLYVRRIAQRRVGKYDLFHFIQETHNGYGFSAFSTLQDLENYLVNVVSGLSDDDSLLQKKVFLDERNIWLFIVDTEKKDFYSSGVTFTTTIKINR